MKGSIIQAYLQKLINDLASYLSLVIWPFRHGGFIFSIVWSFLTRRVGHSEVDFLSLFWLLSNRAKRVDDKENRKGVIAKLLLHTTKQKKVPISTYWDGKGGLEDENDKLHYHHQHR